jgi:hypothetical protein
MKALLEEKLSVFEQSTGEIIYNYTPGKDVFVNIYFTISPDSFSVAKAVKQNYPDAEQKVFKKTNVGFEAATAYFEELIYKEENKDKDEDESGGDGNESMPPVGIIKCYPDGVWELSMQDGRKAKYENDAIEIIEGQLIVIIPPAKQAEIFFCQKTPISGMYALYPVSDGEAPPRSGKVNTSDDKEAENSAPSAKKEEAKSEGAQASGVDERQRLATAMGFVNYQSMMAFYTTKARLIQQILGFNEEELEMLASKLKLHKDNLINQIEDIIS